MQELMSRVEQDPKLLRELLSIFLEEFPVKVQKLQEALEHEDLAQAIVFSHGLKGMLSNLSVTQAASCAAQMEQMARNGQMALVKQTFTVFEQELRGLLPELQAHLAEARR